MPSPPWVLNGGWPGLSTVASGPLNASTHYTFRSAVFRVFTVLDMKTMNSASFRLFP